MIRPHRLLGAVALVLVPAVALAGYSASSFKKDEKYSKATTYTIAAALDSKPETAWISDPEQEPVGQWVEIDVPAATVDKLGIMNGWQMDDNTRGDYARIKKIKVDMYDLKDMKLQGSAEVVVEDKAGWQAIELPDTKVGTEMLGGKLKLTITEVYPGQDFPNIAVSELLVQLVEFPAENQKLDRDPDTSGAGHGPEMMLDKNPKTFWSATQNTANFAVSGPGYGLASLMITAGPKENARPKTIEMSANGVTVQRTLENLDTPQSVKMPAIVGYTGSTWGSVEVKILDVYPGTTGLPLAITEMQVMAATVEDI